MNASEIRRLLENSGVRVLDADLTSVSIEDPSCILRGFETFINYAWIIIVAVTAFLLLGWAISLIRGAKNDIVKNMRSLFLIFAALSLVKPILNTIYQGDLFGVGCKTITVPIADLNTLLEARHSRLSGRSGELYEDIDIQDTGVPIPVQSSDDDPGEIVPIYYRPTDDSSEIVPIHNLPTDDPGEVIPIYYRPEN